MKNALVLKLDVDATVAVMPKMETARTMTSVKSLTFHQAVMMTPRKRMTLVLRRNHVLKYHICICCSRFINVFGEIAGICAMMKNIA